MNIFLRDKIVNPLCKTVLPYYSLIIVVSAIYFLFQARYGVALFILYLVPLLTWRFLNLVYPLKEGTSYIAGSTFSPWLSSYRIQEIYLRFPFLEKVIMLTPFLYNVWLRLWGSKVGKRVIFTHNISITDRSGLVIGNNVYFGDQCYLSCHFVLEKNKKLLLIYKKIRIEDDVFIGSFTKFSPGAVAKKGSRVNTHSFFGLNSSKAESFIARLN